MDRGLRVEGLCRKGMREELYLHRSLTPLEKVDFDAQSPLRDLVLNVLHRGGRRC